MITSRNTEQDNDFGLSFDRFLRAQERMYQTALHEIELGEKQSHWMWYIFPQHVSLGHSFNARRYGILSLEHAQEYLEHKVLGSRLREVISAVLQHRDKSAQELLSSDLDALKLKSSLTLFSRAARSDADRAIFHEALEVFYEGAPCDLTLSALCSEERS